MRLVLLAKTGNVPDSNGKVHRGGDDQIVPGMKLSTPRCQLKTIIGGSRDIHDVVVVSRQNGNTRPRLPVPDPDSLIVRSRDDPRVLSMEEDRSDIVEIYYMSSWPLLHLKEQHNSRPVKVKRHFLCL